MEHNGYRGRKKETDCISILDFWMENFMRIYQGKKISDKVQDTNWSSMKTVFCKIHSVISISGT